MLVGVVFGLLLGPNSFVLPQTAVALGDGAVVLTELDSSESHPLATGLKNAHIVSERAGDPPWIQVQWTLNASEVLRLRSKDIEQAKTIEAGHTAQGWMKDTVPEVRRYAPLGQTLVNATEWIGQLFLALIKMVVVPLVFLSLVVGVASLGDLRALGRLGGRTLLYFSGTTVVALVIGVGLANLLQPGALLSEADREILLASYRGDAATKVENAANAPGFTEQLIGIVPANPVSALANGEMLQIIFFALMLGLALTYLKPERSKLVVDVFDRLNDAVVMLVHLAMVLAPYGVAALLFKVVGSTGPTVLVALLYYTIIVLAGLTLHLVLMYGTVIQAVVKISFPRFLLALREALLVAFSTSSSSATLPVTKECCEQNLSIRSNITSFILPLGATVNMDGTALYQGVAAVFIAQIYGIDLSLADQATIVGSATLASVGAAGVPGAGMITLAMVLTAIGVPTEGLALVLGVDRLLDMFRTATNVAGDSTAAALMAHLEGDKLSFLSPAEDVGDPDHGFEGRLQGGPQPIPVKEEESAD